MLNNCKLTWTPKTRQDQKESAMTMFTEPHVQCNHMPIGSRDRTPPQKRAKLLLGPSTKQSQEYNKEYLALQRKCYTLAMGSGILVHKASRPSSITTDVYDDYVFLAWPGMIKHIAVDMKSTRTPCSQSLDHIAYLFLRTNFALDAKHFAT